MMRKKRHIFLEIILLIFTGVIFGIPFFFVIINSFKTKAEASQMSMALPTEWNIVENYTKVFNASNRMVLTAFKNSAILTIISVPLIVITCSMLAFYIQRRSGKISDIISFIILTGLMIPPAIVPTIWVLEALNLYKTLWGLIFIEVALAIPFSTMLYRGFMGSIPKEIDESAVIDGCGTMRLFFQIIFPLLKPVTATIVILSSINVFNDFSNPLYFLPGAENATVQLTLYNFSGQYASSWNLLFADIVIISIPMLILFILFNKQIVSGMTSGAVKG